ncbi:hypothetical protein L596_009172 [Steinernema carpocapsae]|uniref:Uncharacterized protein n=1 Tax=Steinernema carpocapsae TaxID=34508 RepID=A0A4U5PF01_STECR|nr:hypothetical protein L596_009172 [Steinernema carpocapsae]
MTTEFYYMKPENTFLGPFRRTHNFFENFQKITKIKYVSDLTSKIQQNRRLGRHISPSAKCDQPHPPPPQHIVTRKSRKWRKTAAEISEIVNFLFYRI